MRFLLALVGLLGAGLLFAGPAAAHATVVGSSPTDGQRLSSPPSSVTVDFDEQVGLGSLGYLHVTDQAGRRVESGPAVHPGGNATKVAVQLRSGLGDGTYTGSYRVVSADAHPVAGVVRFVVGNGALTATTVVASTSGGGVAAAFDAARWVSWVGFALLGGAWLLLTVWPAGRDDRRARRIVWTGWLLAAFGATAELLLQGAYAVGSSMVTAFRPSLVDATLHTNYGLLHSVRLVLLGVVAVVLGAALQPGRSRARLDDAFWPLGLGIAYTFAAVGHASTTSPAWLSVPVDMLHVTAMAMWVGGLVVLLAAVLPRREPDELRAVLPVFSKVAFTAVLLLATTGSYAAWRGTESWRALLHTEYGLLVVAKIVLFCGLLAVANLSRRLVQSRVRGPVVAFAMTSDAVDVQPAPRADDAAERMRRSVLVELVIAAVVLALTAVLVNQPRGMEALAADDRAPVSATAALGGGRTATVTVDPGRHGAVSVDVALSAGTVPESVTGTASEPAKQLGPIPLKLAAHGKNLYSASGIDLPVAGSWVIALVVTTSQFAATTTDVKVTLK